MGAGVRIGALGAGSEVGSPWQAHRGALTELAMAKLGRGWAEHPTASSRSRSVTPLCTGEQGQGEPPRGSREPAWPWGIHADVATWHPPAPALLHPYPKAHLSSPPGCGALPGTPGPQELARMVPPFPISSAWGYL